MHVVAGDQLVDDKFGSGEGSTSATCERARNGTGAIFRGGTRYHIHPGPEYDLAGGEVFSCCCSHQREGHCIIITWMRLGNTCGRCRKRVSR
jgi:hypothetical protein